jgi:hypothetical protein
MSYDYTAKYEKIKKELLEEYGTKHLCGNCKYTTECKRAIIQGIKGIERKKRLVKAILPFVVSFEVEEYIRRKDDGFIYVYDCDNFEFEGV